MKTLPPWRSSELQYHWHRDFCFFCYSCYYIDVVTSVSTFRSRHATTAYLLHHYYFEFFYNLSIFLDGCRSKVFLQAGRPSCRPTSSVKALKVFAGSTSEL